MSAPPPAQGASPAAPSEKRAPKRRPRRAVDTLNLLLVMGALGVVIISASPALLRAAGLTRPHADDPDIPHAGRVALPKPAPLPTEHSIFGPLDDEDDELDPGWTTRTPEERRRDREIFPRKRDPSAERRDPLAEPDRKGPRVHDPSPGAGETTARFGVVQKTITVLEKPTAGSRSLGELQRGDMVMVLKEAEDYALIAHSGDDGVVMGWAKKSEIAVR